jgi:DNA-binding NarL/FixJ family response regulator
MVTPGPAGRGPHRIVLVDDSIEFRGMLRTLLGCHADLHVVGEAADGLAAVTTVAQHAPDVVVTDLQMPGLDGIALTRSLRLSHPGLPVVMLTGFPGPDAMDEAFSAGVTAFLDKRTGVAQLADLLRDVLAPPTPPVTSR